ncbi:hypothetical protein [Homoserinimonas sp. A520]
MKNTLTIASIIGVLSLTLVGCSGGDQSEPIDDPKKTAPAEVVEESTEPDGSRAKPYLAGTKSLLAEGSIWTVGFQPSNLDSAAIVMAENQFNELLPGHSAVMAPITIDVLESGGQDISDGVDPFYSLTFEFVSDAGRSYGEGATSCGVIPSDFYDIGNLFSGATASANVCAQVPADEVEGGLWSVTNMQGDKLFFTLT